MYNLKFRFSQNFRPTQIAFNANKRIRSSQMEWGPWFWVRIWRPSLIALTVSK